MTSSSEKKTDDQLMEEVEKEAAELDKKSNKDKDDMTKAAETTRRLITEQEQK